MNLFFAMARLHNYEKMHEISFGKNAEIWEKLRTCLDDIQSREEKLAENAVAAIEAARAGEAGRGFAVVADEVRKLAEKTVSATIEVEKSIKNIQASTTKNIAVVETTAEKVDTITNLSEESANVLNEIVLFANETNRQTDSIATAVEQQAATSEEINRNITGIYQVAEQTASGMQQAEDSVNNMLKQVEKLEETVKKLKK